MNRNKLIINLVKYGVIFSGIIAAFIYLMTCRPAFLSETDRYKLLARLVNSGEWVFIFVGSLIIMLIGMSISYNKGKRAALENLPETEKKLIAKLQQDIKRLKQREVDHSELYESLKKENNQRRIYIKSIEAVRENYIREKAGMI